MARSTVARSKSAGVEDPHFELTFSIPRWLERLVDEEANRRWQGGLQQQKSGARRQRSKSAVVKDAVRFFLAGRVAGESIGEQLRQARAELSLPQLSAMTAEAGKGLAPSVIWRIENEADRSPRLSSLRSLAKALDVSIVIDPDGVAVLRRNA